MTKNAENLEGWTEAYHRGCRVGLEANVPGKIFVGASPEAEKAGYAHGTARHTVFVTGFLRHLRTPVRTNAENVIV